MGTTVSIRPGSTSTAVRPDGRSVTMDAQSALVLVLAVLLYWWGLG